MKLLAVIRHTLWSALPMFVIILTLVVMIGQASSVEPVIEKQTQLERRFTQLKRDHVALEHWVAKVLRPWVIEQARKQAEALPSGAPTPSLDPLAPVPSGVPTPSVTPIPSVIPSVIPSGSPEPSPELPPTPSLCLPVICSAVPSVEGGIILSPAEL